MQLETRIGESTFTVTGAQPLLVEALRLLVAQSQPEAKVYGVEVSPGDTNHEYIRVDLGDGDRWMAVLTGEAQAGEVIGALRDGAASFATIDGSLGDFRRALQALVDGTDAGVPATLARQWLYNGSENGNGASLEKESYPPLTAREREVLARVASGLSNQRIARDLSISVHTVRTHLSSMSAKLGAGNRVHLVRIAARLGYPEADLAAEETV